MAFIAAAYYWMNRADPDCGTTFAWMTQLDGAVARVAGRLGDRRRRRARDAEPRPGRRASTRSRCSATTTRRTLEVTIVGIAWIIVMTAICYIGIELSARTQQVLLGIEFVTLVLFAVVALIKVYADPSRALDRAGRRRGSTRSTSRALSALDGGILLAVFVYWGWDSGVSVNEETEDSSTAPGRAAIISTFVLVGIYLLVTTAAQAYGGVQSLVEQPERRAVAARPRRARLAARQAADHLRADLGVGVDADDDPADRPHDPVDGAMEGDPQAVRQHPPALPDPGFLDDLDGDRVDDRLRASWPRPSPEPDRRRVHLAGADDRLLLRVHRPGVRRLLPPPPVQERRGTSSTSACCR